MPEGAIDKRFLMTERRITAIPIPGGSGSTPTGAMQFQDDWPGLFLRGDDAKNGEMGLPSRLGRIAEIIRRDVIQRGGPLP
jgi:hypothetical protein